MIVISPADLAAIEAQASAAAPNEACITGADGFAVTSVHPSDNLAWKPMEMFEVPTFAIAIAWLPRRSWLSISHCRRKRQVPICFRYLTAKSGG